MQGDPTSAPCLPICTDSAACSGLPCTSDRQDVNGMTWCSVTSQGSGFHMQTGEHVYTDVTVSDTLTVVFWSPTAGEGAASWCGRPSARTTGRRFTSFKDTSMQQPISRRLPRTSFRCSSSIPTFNSSSMTMPDPILPGRPRHFFRLVRRRACNCAYTLSFKNQ